MFSQKCQYSLARLRNQLHPLVNFHTSHTVLLRSNKNCACSRIFRWFLGVTISDILSSIENIPISTWWTLNHCACYGIAIAAVVARSWGPVELDLGRSLPFDITQNTEHILLLYLGIYEPYGDADEDAEGIALHRMGYQPVNLTQSKLLCVGPTQRKWRRLASYLWTGTDHEKVHNFKY